MPHRFLLIETVSIAYAIISAVVASVAAGFGTGAEVALLDDSKMRLICISGALFGSLLSILIFPPNGGTARAFLIKLMASSIAGVIFTPVFFHWLPLPRNTDWVLLASATTALLAVGVIKIAVPKAERLVGSRILTEAGQVIQLPPLTILYAEDEKEASELVVRFLETMPARVDVVETLQGARNAIDSIDYDVVVLDLNLTDSRSAATRAAVQGIKQSANAPVVVLSGLVEPHLRQSYIEAGADVFLHKLDAFEHEGRELFRAIRKALLHHPNRKHGNISRQIAALDE